MSASSVGRIDEIEKKRYPWKEEGGQNRARDVARCSRGGTDIKR